MSESERREIEQLQQREIEQLRKRVRRLRVALARVAEMAADLAEQVVSVTRDDREGTPEPRGVADEGGDVFPTAPV